MHARAARLMARTRLRVQPSFRLCGSAHTPRPSRPSALPPQSCVICFEAPRETVLIPCGHMLLCEECCGDVRQGTGECPGARRARQGRRGARGCACGAARRGAGPRGAGGRRRVGRPRAAVRGIRSPDKTPDRALTLRPCPPTRPPGRLSVAVCRVHIEVRPQKLPGVRGERPARPSSAPRSRMRCTPRPLPPRVKGPRAVG